MKKTLLAAISILFILSGCTKATDGFVINGKTQCAKSGIIYLKSFRNKMFFNIDSTNIVDGKFTFKGKVDQPLLFALQSDDMDEPLQFFLENKNLNIDIDSVKGHPDSSTIVVKRSPINVLFSRTLKLVTDDNYNIDTLITDYPGSPVVAYYLYRYYSFRLPLDQLKKERAKFSPSIAKHSYLASLDTIIGRLEAVQIGKVAPEFSLPDTAGVAVSLKNFRGKYILLDFWASWCPYCRKENPNVVKAFGMFKDKNFTIIGISLDRNKDNWIEAINHDGLTWTQVSDLKFWDSQIPELYGVRGIPANLLLDTAGVIVERNIMGDDLIKALQKHLR